MKPKYPTNSRILIQGNIKAKVRYSVPDKENRFAYKVDRDDGTNKDTWYYEYEIKEDN